MQSARTLLRASTPLSRVSRPQTSALAYAAGQRRAASHDSHAASSSSTDESYPEEGFHAPFWRNGVLVALAVALVYRITPTSTHPTLSTDLEESPNAITRYIAYYMPDPKVWKQNSDKHLQLAKEMADDKLLFQEAERPRVKRLRYTGTFQQASPNNIPVGSQADLSDLNIKSEKDDFSFGKDASADAEAEDDE